MLPVPPYPTHFMQLRKQMYSRPIPFHEPAAVSLAEAAARTRSDRVAARKVSRGVATEDGTLGGTARGRARARARGSERAVLGTIFHNRDIP